MNSASGKTYHVWNMQGFGRAHWSKKIKIINQKCAMNARTSNNYIKVCVFLFIRTDYVIYTIKNIRLKVREVLNL
jgi:hypothetical protein